ncbi:MAG TPA: alpha-1,6-glucosidase domain-containing protein [Xanthomonadaceae bacterium]|nr:alpha-1,6-glucosidase domain-containing protein [Xanthomonadaceae bacterium]
MAGAIGLALLASACATSGAGRDPSTAAHGFPVHAAPAPAPFEAADCRIDAASSFRLQESSGWPSLPAHAHWLDRRLLHWPGAPADGRYALYHSAGPTLVAHPGEAVRGGAGRIGLSVETGPLPQALAMRYAFLAGGVRLALPRTALANVPSLLRGQLALVREDADGHVLEATSLQVPGVLDDVYAAAAGLRDFGATTTGDGTAFRVWAPTARAAALCLYDGEADHAGSLVPLQRDDATGTWATTLAGHRQGAYYTYLVDVVVGGAGLVRNRVTDPYSVSLDAGSRRSYIADLDDPALAPPGWGDTPRPPALASATDMVVYELHVRDFSRDDATVPPPHRGKYLAFTDRDSNGMRHLRALADAGLTDVHLLPVFDIASVPEAGCVEPAIPHAGRASEAQQAAVEAVAAEDCFNWGYDPWHFNAPEGSYASTAEDGATRIREFRAMVQALHAAGLRVGMDVVYNHTTASGLTERSVLDRIVPGYYHRLDAEGGVTRSTCCDNTATEHAMMAKLMIDSTVSWATQYGIDSFRFDLMGHQPRAAMERLQAAVDAATGRHVDLFGEGWDFGEVADGARFVQASQLSLHGSGIGTFSDRARDAIRGGGPADRGADSFIQGYVNGLHYAPNGRHAGTRAELLHAADLVRVGLAGTLRDYRMVDATGTEVPLSAIDYKGQPAGYAAQPGEVVNYVENHDNQTLFDVNVFKLPQGTPPRERARVQLLALALNAFSQGTAYFHAGGELLRSKSLDRNSFDSGDWFNRIDWSARDNHFGTGLPRAADNRQEWDLMRPLLLDASIDPAPSDIAFTREVFLDLLRIRDSSTLFRLRTADDVRQRLRFHNTGPGQDPVLVAAHLDGRGYPGAAFAEVLYLVNVAPTPGELVVADAAGKAYTLHPVQATGADPRARDARFDPATGRFGIPPRTAVVFVIPAKE